MTEDEAKTKWCPFSRTSHYNSAVNRCDPSSGYASEIERRTRCIASTCLAWRWSTDPVQSTFDGDKQGSGFCGLAGQPQ